MKGKDLKNKAISIKGKSYVQVKDRILYLSQNHEGEYSIDTTYVYYPEKKMWVVKAKLTIKGESYTGLAQEIESNDYKQVNHSSALENAETSAVGRACAMAGIGVLDSIASVDEMNKAVRRSSPASEKQVEFIDNLFQEYLNLNGVSNIEIAIKALCQKHFKVDSVASLSSQQASIMINKLKENIEQLQEKKLEEVADLQPDDLPF